MHSSRTAISKTAPDIVLKSVFNKYDTYHNGNLDRNAFSHVLEDLGIDDEIEQHALFALADNTNSKTITFKKFLNLIQSNDFEGILSNQDDYLFVIETYQNFLEFDTDGSGEISWDKFYFYLHKHGYSHEYISNYWHYINQNGPNASNTISFEQFWKAFRAQSEAYKVRILHSQINQQIELFAGDEISNQKTKIDKKRVSIIPNNNNKNVLIQAVKKKLKPTKVKKSAYKSKVGRVLDDNSDDEDENENEEKLPEFTNINSESISNWVMERDLDEYSDADMEDDSTSISDSDVSVDSLDSETSSDCELPSLKNSNSAPHMISPIPTKENEKEVKRFKEITNIEKQEKDRLKKTNINVKNKYIKKDKDRGKESKGEIKTESKSAENKKKSTVKTKVISKPNENKKKAVKNDKKKEEPKKDDDKKEEPKKYDKKKPEPKKYDKKKPEPKKNDKKKVEPKKDDKKKAEPKKYDKKKVEPKKADKKKPESKKDDDKKEEPKKYDKKKVEPKKADKKKAEPKKADKKKVGAKKHDKIKSETKSKISKNIINERDDKKEFSPKTEKIAIAKLETETKIDKIKSETKSKTSKKIINERDDKKEDIKINESLSNKKMEDTNKHVKKDKKQLKVKTKTKSIEKNKGKMESLPPKTLKKTKPSSPKSTKSPKKPKSPKTPPKTPKKDKIKIKSTEKTQIKIKSTEKNKKQNKIKTETLSPKTAKKLKPSTAKPEKISKPKLTHDDDKKEEINIKNGSKTIDNGNLKLKINKSNGDKNKLKTSVKKHKGMKRAKSELPRIKKKDKVKSKVKPAKNDPKSREKQRRAKDIQIAKKRLSKRLSLKFDSINLLNGTNSKDKKPTPLISISEHKPSKPSKSSKTSKTSKTNKSKLPMRPPTLQNLHSAPTPVQLKKASKNKTSKNSNKKILLQMSSSHEIDEDSAIASPIGKLGKRNSNKGRDKKRSSSKHGYKKHVKDEKKFTPKTIIKTKSHDAAYDGKKIHKKTLKDKPKKSGRKHEHVRKPTFGMGFALFSGLRKKNIEIKKEEKQKELKRKREKRRKVLRKSLNKSKLKPIKETNHIRERSQTINELGGLIDFKPHVRSHKYIFRHLHEKTNRLIPADSSKWDRNWNKIYKQREKIAAIKKKQRENKLKDFKTLQKERKIKIDEANQAFIDPHYKLPIYAAHAGHWDRDWDKINQSRQEIDKLKQKKREDKKKDFKTLQREKQERIDEVNKAFINPHYKLPVYAAYAGHWDRDWNKIDKARSEIDKLKMKKRKDKKKDAKVLFKEKRAKIEEANQAFIDPHYKLPVYAANKSNWDRDWDKINKARSEIRLLKQKQREKKLLESDKGYISARGREMTPEPNIINPGSGSEVKGKNKKKLVRAMTTDDIRMKIKSEKKNKDKKYGRIKLQNNEFVEWINENGLCEIENVFIDFDMYKIELIHFKNPNFEKLMADERILSKSNNIAMKMKDAIQKLEDKNNEIMMVDNSNKRDSNKKKVKFENNDIGVTFFTSQENDDVKLNENKDDCEAKLFSFDRQRSASNPDNTTPVMKESKSERTLIVIDQKNKDHKVIINEARNNLERFMIRNGFWQIDFFLILVEYGINKPQDLNDLSKSERKEIIKIAKQRGLLSTRVKAFKAYFN